MRVNGGENRLALRFYMLACLNQHSAALAEWSKAVLRLRIFTFTFTFIANIETKLSVNQTLKQKQLPDYCNR